MAEAAGGFNEQDGNKSGPSCTSENVDIDTGYLDQSKNRFGLVRQSKCLVNNSTQTKSEKSYTTPKRKTRNFERKTKAAIATSSAKARITVEQARRAFRASSEVFYNERYYLSVDDVPEASTDPTYENPKRPQSAKDYAWYEHALPSARVINTQKHLQAIQAEKTEPWQYLTLNLKTKLLHIMTPPHADTSLVIGLH